MKLPGPFADQVTDEPYLRFLASVDRSGDACIVAAIGTDAEGYIRYAGRDQIMRVVDELNRRANGIQTMPAFMEAFRRE